MRVFMLGWEFPPFISGGLGTACYGLTKALSAIDTEVIFVLPRPLPAGSKTDLPEPSRNGKGNGNGNGRVSVRSPAPAPEPTPSTASIAPQALGIKLDEFEHVTFRAVQAALNPYQTAIEFEAEAETRRVAHELALSSSHDSSDDRPSTRKPAPAPAPRPAPAGGNAIYSGDLFTEVQRYASLATEIARNEEFDVVHAHDWLTYPAGMAVAALKGKPLVVHVHSTEFDRAGAHIDQRIYDIERRGMLAAMKVIAVSHLTKNLLIQRYGVEPDKIEVVYNAVEQHVGALYDVEKYSIKRGEKLVLFLGRITAQKGPEYFLEAAKKVLEVMDNVKFVMAGSGDMIRHAIELAAGLGIGHKVLFTGFLRGPDVERVFKLADLYVMPSVSEPFGIAPLEAMANDVPVIISKQSGVSEILQHALKVDFWDTNEMANKIVAVLRHPPLARMLREEGGFEISKLSWTDSAEACIKVYEAAIEAMRD